MVVTLALLISYYKGLEEWTAAEQHVWTLYQHCSVLQNDDGIQNIC